MDTYAGGLPGLVRQPRLHEVRGESSPNIWRTPQWQPKIPFLSRCMQSGQRVGLSRIGFLAGGDMTLMQPGDRQPGAVYQGCYTRTGKASLTDRVDVLAAEQAIRPSAVLQVGGHCRHKYMTKT